MDISKAITEGVADGALSLLDKVITLVHEKLIEGGSLDDEFLQGLATIKIWEPQLRKGAASTDTKYDDNILDEIIQAADKILPAETIAGINLLHATTVEEDFLPSEAEGEASPSGPAEEPDGE